MSKATAVRKNQALIADFPRQRDSVPIQKTKKENSLPVSSPRMLVRFQTVNSRCHDVLNEDLIGGSDKVAEEMRNEHTV